MKIAERETRQKVDQGNLEYIQEVALMSEDELESAWADFLEGKRFFEAAITGLTKIIDPILIPRLLTLLADIATVETGFVIITAEREHRA